LHAQSFNISPSRYCDHDIALLFKIRYRFALIIIVSPHRGLLVLVFVFPSWRAR
jgi:hypothetical protein